MTPTQKWCIVTGMFLGGIAFGLSLGTRWSGSALIANVLLWLVGSWLLLPRDDAQD